jgi:putative ABC transport system permease protein
MTVETEPALLPMLGARVALGRPLGPADVNHRLALMTSRLWRRVFHEDPAVIGSPIRVTGHPYTVVGVLADGVPFELPVGDASTPTEFTIKDVDIWMPFGAGGNFPDRRDVWTFEAIGLLRPGVALAEAQAAVDTIGGNLARQFPASNRGRGFRLVPLHQQMVAARAAAIWLGFGGALLMLVIACVNAAGLVLGELPGRRRDFALRQALGAGRARLLRQVAVESALVAVASAIGGGLLARTIERAFIASMDLPRAGAVHLDSAVIAFAIVIASASALASRLLPMLRLDGDEGLRASTSAHAASAPRLRRALVAGQLALALVSCTTAALLGASLRAVLLVDPGFASAHTLSARVSTYEDSYVTREDVTRFFTGLTSRLMQQPGVTLAAAGSSLPFSGTSGGSSVMAEGHPLSAAETITAGWQTATPDFFRAMGIPLRAGRDFSSADLLVKGQHHTVINETLARQLFGSVDVIGRRIGVGPQGATPDWHQIVGVVGDVRQSSLTDAPAPRVYDLFGEHWSRTMFVVVQGRGEAEDLAPLVRGEVRALNPGAPVFDVRTLDDLVNASVAPRRSVAALAGGLGMAALLLAALGVYALLASSVAARTRELGVRRALGASTRAIVALVTREALVLSALGVAAGLGASAAAAGVLQSQLFGVTATNPIVLAACAAGLGTVALAASLGPARRAARVDPAVTLRAE